MQGVFSEERRKVLGDLLKGGERFQWRRRKKTTASAGDMLHSGAGGETQQFDSGREGSAGQRSGSCEIRKERGAAWTASKRQIVLDR